MATPDSTLETWSHLCRVHSAVARRVEGRLVADFGVSLVTFAALRRLAEADGSRLRLSALIDNGSMTKSGISRLVDRLEKSGYIVTEGCPSDRRGSFAILTDSGKAI